MVSPILIEVQPLPGLKVRIKKNRTGAGSLSCERADGSITWQRQSDRTAAFFAHHDLTHYAVETSLGCTEAFLGLVASGWEIGDFGSPWPKGPLPKEAERVELIVGFLDVERASGEEWSAEEFNRNAAMHSEARGSDTRAAVTDEGLRSIRSTRRDLFGRWAAVEPGGVLELRFD